MRTAGRQQSESGFTLVELLVVLIILAIIGPALTESVITGLRTTTGTADKVGDTSALANLNTYFYGDVQSADQLSTTTSPTVTGCNVTAFGSGTFLHLSWTNQDPSTSTDVFYVFDPATGADQNLTRVTCTGSGAPDITMLGHFSNDASSPPITYLCGSPPCTVSPPENEPASVTLRVHSDPAAPVTDLTAERRRSVAAS